MYKTAAGKYVVLLAGATCFGVPQPDSGSWSGNFPVGPATQRWGGTGIFAYVADKPLGPYTLHGNVNNAAGGLHNSSGEHSRWQTTVSRWVALSRDMALCCRVLGLHGQPVPGRQMRRAGAAQLHRARP